MIITIDGPSGTGKTTVARNVANKLHFVYFDTGAMYRAFTWLIIEHAVDIDDPQALQRCLEEFDYRIVEDNPERRYFVGSVDVTEAIRSRAVTKTVSPVSALRQVRTFLLDFQYRFAKTQDAVFEGRDLGTVVFPKAEIKIFLSADPKVRAERRLQEILSKKPDECRRLSCEQMLVEIMSRDEYDSNREVAPLRCPPDAFQIDTTHLSIDQVVVQIVKCCTEKFPDKFFL
jgi:cytidylate kinase